MKHDCHYAEDGHEYHPFQDAIVNGYIEYDDWYDGYLVIYKSHEKISTKKIFGIWLPRRYRTCMDILQFCPYCGSKIYDDIRETRASGPLK